MPVDNSGALAKTQAIIEALMETKAAALAEVATALQAQVVASSPTPDEEYHDLMVGSGGDATGIPALGGDQSVDDDPKQQGRIRFAKDAGTWIADLNADPLNVTVTEDMASIGFLPFLVEKSVFHFKNYVPPPKNRRKGETYPTEAYTSPPYFLAFEYGTGDSTGWTGEIHADGEWRLRPSTDDTQHPPGPRTMSKPIEGRFMYRPTDLEQTARSILDGLFANEGPTS